VQYVNINVFTLHLPTENIPFSPLATIVASNIPDKGAFKQKPNKQYRK